MARYAHEEEPSGTVFLAIGGTVILVGFLVITLFMGVFKIDEYERGVITRYGAFQRIAQPGVNFRIPWIDGLQRMDMRETNPKFLDMEMYSSDQQLAKNDVSVVLSPRLDKLQEIYTKYGSVDNAVKVVLGPVVPAEVKVVFGRYTAQRAIQERDKLNVDTKERILFALGEKTLFNIIRVPVEDIEFSKAYVQSIEENMKAEVEVRKIKNNWEKEKVAADIIKTQADAIAYQIKTRGDAEALAIEAKTKALANNPKYIEMIQAEKWNGVLPTTVLPSTAVPMINVK